MNRINFDIKEKYKESTLWITNALVAYDEWTIENIKHRQRELAEIAIKTWSVDI